MVKNRKWILCAFIVTMVTIFVQIIIGGMTTFEVFIILKIVWDQIGLTALH